jgi:hypothetical protein
MGSVASGRAAVSGARSRRDAYQLRRRITALARERRCAAGRACIAADLRNCVGRLEVMATSVEWEGRWQLAGVRGLRIAG